MAYDTPWVGSTDDKLYLQSGQFTSTLKTSQYVGSIDTSPRGIGYDGTNTPWCGATDYKLYLQSGQFTSTLKTSLYLGNLYRPTGISSDSSHNTFYSLENPSTVLYHTSGQFTTTVKDNLFIADYPVGIDYDELNGNTFYCADTASDKLFIQSGAITSTVKSSLSVGAKDVWPRGISCDADNTTWIGSFADKLYLQSGKITSTIKTSVSVGGVELTPEGLCTNDLIGRLGFNPPGNVVGTSGHAKVTITFDPSLGADSYNLYWLDSSPVTVLNGTKIEGIISGYEWNPPAGYDTGQTYYFIVTSYSAIEGESDASSEVSGFPYWLDMSASQALADDVYSITQQTSTGYWFAGCNSGQIYRSTDGGINWVLKSSTDNNTVRSMCVTVNGYIYATSSIGRIYYSNDDGANFAEASVLSWGSGFNGVAGDSAWAIDYSGNRVYVVGKMQFAWDTLVAYSDDYGANWYPLPTLGLGNGGIVYDIDVVSQTEIYITTATGAKIMKYNGSSWSDISDAAIAPYKIIVPGDNNIYVGEWNGNTLRYSANGGVTWATFTGADFPDTTTTHDIVYSYGIFYSGTGSGTTARLYMTDSEQSAYESTYRFPVTDAMVRAIYVDCPNGILVCGADENIYKSPLPPPQSNTTLAASGGTEEVELTWDIIPGATSYTLYWSLTPGVSKLDNNISSVSSPYTHSIVSPGPYGVPYYYVVTSIGCGGESIISNEVNAIPLTGTPDTPTNFEAVATSSSIINLSWNVSSGAVSYNIYWSLTPGVTTADNAITGISGTSYDHGGRISGITYYYRVEAVGIVENSSLSIEDNAVCPFDVGPFQNLLWHLMPKGRFWQK